MTDWSSKKHQLISCVLRCTAARISSCLSHSFGVAALPVRGASDHPQTQTWDDPQVLLHQDGYSFYRWECTEETSSQTKRKKHTLLFTFFFLLYKCAICHTAVWVWSVCVCGDLFSGAVLDEKMMTLRYTVWNQISSIQASFPQIVCAVKQSCSCCNKYSVHHLKRPNILISTSVKIWNMGRGVFFFFICVVGKSVECKYRRESPGRMGMMLPFRVWPLYQIADQLRIYWPISNGHLMKNYETSWLLKQVLLTLQA